VSLSGYQLLAGADFWTSRTEVLDLAPIDLLNGMTKEFIGGFPSELVSDELKAKALDIEFHWVNETGKTALLTAGLNVDPTVIEQPARNKRAQGLMINL
jgi:hypothetical protein